ncbi:TRAF3-interacting protein 1 isoform X2 [Fukomys damarensis]|uniref:TRAF3-interacting protein 1 isoform X2 n=1 Tax=Fukomys damarensis TaxID=885580 RepID=UPI0014551841|nr:TRAF3-interacting protein 1 isoform X2 [Fukomys damarensis]
MKSDNVKDKDAKISFLQKAIDVVVLVSGEPLSARPARIVAGHEPERTNELLQMVGKCCLNKLSSDDAVKRVLAGEKGDARGRAVRTSKSHELDKSAREEESRRRKDKEVTRKLCILDSGMVEVSSRVSRSLASKTSKQRFKNSVEGDSASDAEGEAGPGVGPPLPEKPEVSENPEVPSELLSSARSVCGGPCPGQSGHPEDVAVRFLAVPFVVYLVLMKNDEELFVQR